MTSKKEGNDFQSIQNTPNNKEITLPVLPAERVKEKLRGRGGKEGRKEWEMRGGGGEVERRNGRDERWRRRGGMGDER